VITTNNLDAKNVLIVIKKFQHLSACRGRKPRFNIHFSDTPNAKVPLHHTPANKGLVLLGLIKSPYQRPHLNEEIVILTTQEVEKQSHKRKRQLSNFNKAIVVAQREYVYIYIYITVHFLAMAMKKRK